MKGYILAIFVYGIYELCAFGRSSSICNFLDDSFEIIRAQKCVYLYILCILNLYYVMRKHTHVLPAARYKGQAIRYVVEGKLKANAIKMLSCCILVYIEMCGTYFQGINDSMVSMVPMFFACVK